MLRRNLTKWTLAAGVAVSALALNLRSSEAHFGHHGSGGSSGGSWGSSGGSWGSSGGSWGSSGGSWGSSGGSWGSSGGSSGGWGHHRAYYSSGGSWGSSGGSSGGYVYWGSSGGSSGGSWGSSGGTVIYDGSPVMPAAPSGSSTTPTPGPSGDAPPAPMSGAMFRSMDGGQTALLNVNVPADAKIFVNGAATTSTGSQRQYVSRGLSAGNRYAYEIKAEFVRDGQTVTETKNVTIGPGEYASLAFIADANAAPVAAGNKAKTKVTLHVPADAKVYLSGRETTSTGETREFTTSKLAPGAAWQNYTVRVVANVDGRDVSKEESITLTGGENRELSFDFNSNAVASTAAVTR